MLPPLKMGEIAASLNTSGTVPVVSDVLSIVRVPIGYFSKRVHPKGVVDVFAFFGSLDGPEQNKT